MSSSADPAGNQRQLPGNALFVGAGGGAGAHGDSQLRDAGGRGARQPGGRPGPGWPRRLEGAGWRGRPSLQVGAQGGLGSGRTSPGCRHRFDFLPSLSLSGVT